jgi:hypothetical protein
MPSFSSASNPSLCIVVQSFYFHGQLEIRWLFDGARVGDTSVTSSSIDVDLRVIVIVRSWVSSAPNLFPRTGSAASSQVAAGQRSDN